MSASFHESPSQVPDNLDSIYFELVDRSTEQYGNFLDLVDELPSADMIRKAEIGEVVVGNEYNGVFLEITSETDRWYTYGTQPESSDNRVSVTLYEDGKKETIQSLPDAPSASFNQDQLKAREEYIAEFRQRVVSKLKECHGASDIEGLAEDVYESVGQDDAARRERVPDLLKSPLMRLRGLQSQSRTVLSSRGQVMHL